MPVKEAVKINFTKSYDELQKITAWFERDEVDIEEGIKQFEKGMELVKELKEYLQTMEVKISKLKNMNELL